MANAPRKACNVRLEALIKEIDDQEQAQKNLDSNSRGIPYDYKDRPANGAIEVDFEKLAEERRAKFREYFWRAGKYPDAKMRFFQLVGETSAGKLRGIRRRITNAIGVALQGETYETLWHTDDVLKLNLAPAPDPATVPNPPPGRNQSGGRLPRWPRDPNKPKPTPRPKEKTISTVEVAKRYPEFFMMQHGGALRGLPEKDVTKSLQEKEPHWEELLAIVPAWVDKFESIHRDIENMLDEVSTRMYQASRIRHHMKREGFYPPQEANPDDHMITLSWYEDGQKEVIKKAFKNRRSALAFLREFERPIKTIRGGGVPYATKRGTLQDRILEQAFLSKRLDILERELRFFLHNQEGSTLQDGDIYTKKELAKLQAFYERIKGLLRKTRETRRANDGYFDPSNPQHGHDISDWGIGKTQTAEFWREVRLVAGDSYHTTFSKVIGLPLSWVGRTLRIPYAENWGSYVSNSAKIKQFHARMKDSIKSKAQRRRAEEKAAPFKRAYIRGIRAINFGNALTVTGAGLGTGALAGKSAWDYFWTITSSIHHKYWGSKNACINVEQEDLSDDQSYPYLGDPQNMRQSIYKFLEENPNSALSAIVAGEVPEEPEGEEGGEEKENDYNLHALAEYALLNDELFIMCLANHYSLRFEEIIEMRRYFTPFDPSVDISEKKHNKLYEQFKVLFYKRFLYHKEKLMRDQTERKIFDYVVGMFAELMNDKDGLGECAFKETDLLFKECGADKINEAIKDLAEEGIDLTNLDQIDQFYAQGKIPPYLFRRIQRLSDRLKDQREMVVGVDPIFDQDKGRGGRTGGRLPPTVRQPNRKPNTRQPNTTPRPEPRPPRPRPLGSE